MEQWFTTEDGFALLGILGWHSGVGVLLAWKDGRKPCPGLARTPRRSWTKLPAALGNPDAVAPHKPLFS